MNSLKVNVKFNNQVLLNKRFITQNSLYDNSRKCNICNAIYNQTSRYERFCEKCRYRSEIYKHSEWAMYS